MRALAEILEEITQTEIKEGLNSPRVKELTKEAKNHPAAAAGRDLSPVIGGIGGN